MTHILFKASGVTHLRNNLKNVLNEVYTNNEALIITRPNEENVVIMSEAQVHEMQREINNLKYLLKLNNAENEISNGEVFEFTLESI